MISVLIRSGGEDWRVVEWEAGLTKPDAIHTAFKSFFGEVEFEILGYLP